MKDLPLPPTTLSVNEWRDACVSTAHVAERALAQLMRALKVVEAARELVNAGSLDFEHQKELAGRLLDSIKEYDLEVI